MKKRSRNTRNKRNARNARRFIFASFIYFACFAISSTLAQPQPRLAILELVGDDKGVWTASLREAVKGASFDLLDEDMTKAAARGAGYDGGLNLHRDEARALGQSLGCDYYTLGKVQVARRSASGEQFYFDALIGLFIVETRTGKLIEFIFERAEATTEDAAGHRLKELIKSVWVRSATAVSAASQKWANELERAALPAPPMIEILTERAAGAPAQGMNGPVFYQRLKPIYPEQADLAGIVAVVELEAVFSADGNVGDVEVARWAGFGLDESAIRTVRLLQFKPAEREGKRVTIRGLVRYNFRRPLTQAVQPRATSREEIERLKRSLQEILNPGTKPGLKP